MDDDIPPIDNNKSRGSNWIKLVLAGIAAVAALQLYIIFAHHSSKNTPVYVSSNPPASTTPAVTVPENTTTPPADEKQEIAVAFRVGGVVTQMLFAPGAQVKQGDILATLDKTPFEKTLGVAREKLQSAISQDNANPPSNPNFEAIEAARTRLDAAQHTYDVALEELKKSTARLVPGELSHVHNDNVQNEHDAKVDLEKAQRELTQQESLGREQMEASGYKSTTRIARGDVSAAEADLRDTQLIAPSNGTVVSRNVEVGATVAPGASVYTLSTTSGGSF